jgi:hypothetical protein
MRMKSTILFAMTFAALAGCNRDEHTVTKVEQRLMVAGPQGGVDSFARLQRSLRPTLAVSLLRPVGNGRAEASVTLPADFSGQELVKTTREALDADLSYKFEARRSISTVRS